MIFSHELISTGVIASTLGTFKGPVFIFRSVCFHSLIEFSSLARLIIQKLKKISLDRSIVRPLFTASCVKASCYN